MFTLATTQWVPRSQCIWAAKNRQTSLQNELQMFSQNGSLDVNSERLLAWFHSIGISGDDNGEIEALFSAFDDDGNGVLDQDELLEMMMFLIRGHRQITGSGSVECLISRYLFLFIVLTCFT